MDNFKRPNFAQDEPARRKKKNYNIKEEIPPSYKHNSNDVVFFKIGK